MTLKLPETICSHNIDILYEECNDCNSLFQKEIDNCKHNIIVISYTSPESGSDEIECTICPYNETVIYY